MKQNRRIVLLNAVELSYIPTVPATSQITFSRALSSTSIRFEWSSASGADAYILFVEELFNSPAASFNRTFASLGGQVDGLAPSTTYNCYVFSSNSAGRGARSTTRTITTRKCTRGARSADLCNAEIDIK